MEAMMSKSKKKTHVETARLLGWRRDEISRIEP